MTTTVPVPTGPLAAELDNAPDLAAVAAAHPAVFADLVAAWSDPITELVAPRPRKPSPVRRPLVLPDAPSLTTRRVLRQHRAPVALFDEHATPEQVSWARPR